MKYDRAHGDLFRVGTKTRTNATTSGRSTAIVGLTRGVRQTEEGLLKSIEGRRLVEVVDEG